MEEIHSKLHREQPNGKLNAQIVGNFLRPCRVQKRGEKEPDACRAPSQSMSSQKS